MAAVQFQRDGDQLETVACVARLRSGGSAKLPVTGSGQKRAVMPDQCLKAHPVPRTKGQLRLKLGHEPLGRRADAIERPVQFHFLEQAKMFALADVRFDPPRAGRTRP